MAYMPPELRTHVPRVLLTRPPKPYGIIKTAVLALLTMFISAIAVVPTLALWNGGKLPRSIMSDAPQLSLALLVSTAVQIEVLAWLARNRGWQAADYLGWIVPKPRGVVVALAITLGMYVALMLAFDALHHHLGYGDTVPPFMVDIFGSAREAGGLVMLWIAVVAAGPLTEEIMFRGFLYRGWACSPRAAVPGVVVISALWAIAHVQYDWFLILYLFVHGLMLGWVRWYSGSTMLTFAIHALTNASALVLMTWKVSPAHLIG